MTVELDDEAKEQFSDLTVRGQKEQPYVPDRQKFANVAVIGTPRIDEETGDYMPAEGVFIILASMANNYITDSAEIKMPETTGVFLWNNLIIDDAIEAAGKTCDTIILLSGRSDEIITAPSTAAIIRTMTTDDTTPWESWAMETNHGVFYDSAKQGAPCWVFTSLLRTPRLLPATPSIDCSAFKGITSVAVADKLDDLGISFNFKSFSMSYPRGLWIGNMQAVSWYFDKIVEYDVTQEIAKWVKSGPSYTDAGLSILENNINSIMAKSVESGMITAVIQVFVPRTVAQASSDRSKGIVNRVRVQYMLGKEVRTVYINMASEV